jgi:hypothetical protein
MAIKKWHYGKLILLWAWGGLLTGLSLTHFVNTPVPDSPSLHLSELIFTLAVLIVLSFVTWRWLGSKESDEG